MTDMLDEYTATTRRICVTKHKRATDKTGLRFSCVGKEKEGRIIKIERIAPDGIFANTELQPGMTLLRVNRIDIQDWELARVMNSIRNTHGELQLEVEWRHHRASTRKVARNHTNAKETMQSQDTVATDTKKHKTMIVPSRSWRRAKGLARLDQSSHHAAVVSQRNNRANDARDGEVLDDSWRRLKQLPNPIPQYSRPAPTRQDESALESTDTTTITAVLRQDREERIVANMIGLESDSQSVQIRKQAWVARAQVAAAQVRSYNENDARNDTPCPKPVVHPKPGAFAIAGIGADNVSYENAQQSESGPIGHNGSSGIVDANVETVNQISSTVVYNVEAQLIKDGIGCLSTRARLAISIALIATVTVILLLVAMRNDDSTTPTGPNYSKGPFLRREDLLASIAEYLVSNSNISTVAINRGYPIGTWDVSRLQDFSLAFDSTKVESAGFNEDLSGWDVSHATDMSRMFFGAFSFNQALDSWNVSSVNRMESMFDGAHEFNQPLASWDISSVNSVRRMFRSALKFNQPLNRWNVSSVTLMDQMFSGSAFNQPIRLWNTRSVTTMREMFRYSSFNQSISVLDVSSVRNMALMFRGASDYNHSLCSWGILLTDTSSARYYEMFHETSCPNTSDPICEGSLPSLGNGGGSGSGGGGFCRNFGPFCHPCS